MSAKHSVLDPETELPIDYAAVDRGGVRKEVRRLSHRRQEIGLSMRIRVQSVSSSHPTAFPLR